LTEPDAKPDVVGAQQLITVHPLGGRPMGDNAAHAVVDTNGAVFQYPNRFVTDGSIVPTAVGRVRRRRSG
jgi:cholesterol oxidase